MSSNLSAFLSGVDLSGVLLMVAVVVVTNLQTDKSPILKVMCVSACHASFLDEFSLCYV